MLSRVAEAIYWMGRYIERAENYARYVEVNINLMMDMPSEANQWEPLVITSGDDEDFQERFGEATRNNVLYFLSFDPDNPNSILSCVTRARENARSTRDAITWEMWTALNQFYLMVRQAAKQGIAREDLRGLYDEIIDGAHLFHGVTEATLSRGEPWHFYNLGRMLERADKTSRILDVKYYILLPAISNIGSPLDNIQWAALLKSASALEMYRRQHHVIVPERVVEYLVLDRLFPRSIRYCLNEAENSIHAISGSAFGYYQNEGERAIGRLKAEFDYTGVKDIMHFGLHEYLDVLQLKLNDVGGLISQSYFALQPLQQQTQSQG